MEEKILNGFVIKGSADEEEEKVEEWWIGLNRYQTVKRWEEEYQAAEESRGELGLRKVKRISLETKRYCDEFCRNHSNLSPMSTCFGLYECGVWKIKNKTLKLRDLLESESSQI